MTIQTDPQGDDAIVDSDVNISSHIGDKVLINELDLITVKGIKIDLIPIFNGITLYENLSSAAVSGSIAIRDLQGIIEKFLISGGEELHIKLSKPITNNILLWRQDFIVHKITRTNVLDNLSSVFELQFTTKTFVRSLKRRLFRSFKNKSYTNCVKEIYKEISDNAISTEDSGLTFNTPFISTGLAPHKAIEYIAKRSCSKGKFYVFFERVSPISGLFNGVPFSASHFFGSVDKLIEDSNKNKIYDIVYSQKLPGVIEPDLGEGTLRASSFVRSAPFSHLDAMMTGFYNSKVTTIDPITQTFNLKKFGYVTKDVSNDFYSNRIMSRDNMFATYDDTKYELPGEKIVFSSINDPAGREEWLSTNIYGQISKNLMKIEVSVEGGSNDIGAGSIVNFKVPSHYRKLLNPENPQTPDDIMFSGKYLVTAVRHNITFDGYLKTLELSRGSFSFDIGTRTQNVTVNTVVSKPITSVVNKLKGTKSYTVIPDGTLSEIKTVSQNTTVQFRIFGNFVSLERNDAGNLLSNSLASVNALGIRLYGDSLPNKSSDILNVSQLYIDILQRQPDTEGLNFWLTDLRRGAITLQQIQTTFLNSAEALSLYGMNPEVLITKRSVNQLSKSLKQGVFSTIMEAVVYTYPGNLNNLTDTVYNKIKSDIQRLL
jgi:hypothetical protein